MSAITVVIIAAVCLFIGTGIGILMRVSYIEQADKDVAIAKKQLEDAPIVIESKLGQEMTLEQMELDVVAPRIIQIMRHFNIKLPDYPSIGMYSKEIFQWYNPDSEYTKLVIAGYLRGGRVQIVWTWVKKDPVYILNRETINGYEDAIKAACDSNPIIMYKDDKEESDDGRTETKEA